jgi:hypothetical protein
MPRTTFPRLSLPLHRRGQNTSQKNAPIVIPQPVFAGGICFFLWIRAKAVSRRAKIFIVL